MRLSEFKNSLQSMDGLKFIMPDGKSVPAHFHITEIGMLNKHFIDCGGKERKESKATMQLWTSVDFHHRLKADKVLQILNRTEKLFNGADPEIEVEYQGETIGRYGLAVENGNFRLTATQTDCLAKDNCGIPVEKVKKKLAEITESCCEPGGNCC